MYKYTVYHIIYMCSVKYFEARLEHEVAFITEAVHELLKARRVLKFSYVYGFFLEDGGYKKTLFEMMQVRSDILCSSLFRETCFEEFSDVGTLFRSDPNSKRSELSDPYRIRGGRLLRCSSLVSL